jgi:hypothetical protein
MSNRPDRSKPPPRPKYLVVVEAQPAGVVPATCRLKRWLKIGLRSFGLKATFAVESGLPRLIDTDDDQGDEPHAEPTTSHRTAP